MKPAATPEALEQALARELARLDGWQDPDALWTDNLGIIARGGEGSPVYLDYVEDAGKLIAGPLAPVLADLQRVTAERDEARAKQRDMHRRAQKAESFRERHRSGFNYLMNGKRKERFGRRAAEAALATATAEAASLRAEVEAKDRARWRPIATAPTDRPVVVRMRTDRLQGGWFVATVTLPDPDDDSRFGSCSTIWHYNGDTLMTRFRGTWTDWLDDGVPDRTALARAATAGEGRSDG